MFLDVRVTQKKTAVAAASNIFESKPAASLVSTCHGRGYRRRYGLYLRGRDLRVHDLKRNRDTLRHGYDLKS